MCIEELRKAIAVAEWKTSEGLSAILRPTQFRETLESYWAYVQNAKATETARGYYYLLQFLVDIAPREFSLSIDPKHQAFGQKLSQKLIEQCPGPSLSGLPSFFLIGVIDQFCLKLSKSFFEDKIPTKHNRVDE